MFKSLFGVYNLSPNASSLNASLPNGQVRLKQTPVDPPTFFMLHFLLQNHSMNEFVVRLALLG